MLGPEYAQTDGASKLDPHLKTFDTATSLWVIVVGALAFLVLVDRGLRPSAALSVST